MTKQTLLDYLTMLEESYERKVQTIYDICRRDALDNREYEWTIRLMYAEPNFQQRPGLAEAQKPQDNNLKVDKVENKELEILLEDLGRLEKALQSKKCEFNMQLAKDFDGLSKQNGALVGRLERAESEFLDVSNALEELKVKSDRELANKNAALSVSEKSVAALRSELQEKEREWQGRFHDQTTTVNDLKHRIFVQEQELVKLRGLTDSYRRRIMMYHEDDSTDLQQPQTPLHKPFDHQPEQHSVSLMENRLGMYSSNSSAVNQANVIGVSAAASSDELERLKVYLNRERELNQKLKRLLQSDSAETKLVDEYNRLFNRNTNLEQDNRKLQKLLQLNAIDVGQLESGRDEDIVQDLVDQRDAWRQNTRLLETQVFTLKQELDQIKLNIPAATNFPNATVPSILLADDEFRVADVSADVNEGGIVLTQQQNKTVADIRQSTKAGELEREMLLKNLNLRKEDRLFCILECPYCAPMPILDI